MVYINLKEFKYILTIADEGAISRAAEKLFISQSSLSRFLKCLEEDLCIELFCREPQGVKSTMAGEIFIETARKIESLYSDMRLRLNTLPVSVSSKISFGIPPAKSTLFLPMILKSVQRDIPDLMIDIVEENSDKLELRLMNSSIDVALISTPIWNPNIAYKVMFKEELLFALSSDHPILKFAKDVKSSKTSPQGVKKWIPPKDISGEGFIVLQSGKLRRSFDMIFQSINSYPNIRYVTVDTSTALDMARKGLGIVLASATWARHEDGLSYLSLSEEGIYRDIVMAHSASISRKEPAVRAFEKEVFQICREFAGTKPQISNL